MTTTSSNDMEQRLDYHGFGHVNPWLGSFMCSNDHHMEQQLDDHHGFGHVNSGLESFVYSNYMEQQLDQHHHHGFYHVNPWIESFESVHDRTKYQPQHSIQQVCPVSLDTIDPNSSNQVEKGHKSKNRRPNIWYWPESSKRKAHSQLIMRSTSSSHASSKKAKCVLVSTDLQNPVSPNGEEGKMIEIKNAMESIEEFQKQVKDLSTLYMSLLEDKLQETMEGSQEDEKWERNVRRKGLCQSYISHVEQYYSRIDSLMKYHFNRCTSTFNFKI